jgi:high affinity Mn2+ porin
VILRILSRRCDVNRVALLAARPLIRIALLLGALAALSVCGHSVLAVDAPPTPPTDLEEGAMPVRPVQPWDPLYLGAQVNSVTQHLDPFRSQYSGPNSLTSHGDQEETDTYGIYLGSQITHELQLYVDMEMARGNAPGRAVGLGSLTNGDVIRIGTVDLGEDPYLARLYLQYTVSLAPETIKAERTLGILPGMVAPERLEIKAGKFAVSDDFDNNRYANSTRSQFMTWSLWNNTAWDFAADTRGYTNGIQVAWLTPSFDLRFAEAQVVTHPNGNEFDEDMAHAHSENAEWTWRTGSRGPVLRLLAFENSARMGDYREALNAAKGTGGVPDIIATEKPGRYKWGYGINVEQPLAAAGETGLFLRYGWNDGATEDFMFTEVDQLLSFGLQLCGCHWGRDADRVGIGVAIDDLSAAHREYLQAGGVGFILGDGQLNYGQETVTEIYYRIQWGHYVQISPDYQYYENPGYNRDRGPAQVYSFRLRIYDL